MATDIRVAPVTLKKLKMGETKEDNSLLLYLDVFVSPPVIQQLGAELAPFITVFDGEPRVHELFPAPFVTGTQSNADGPSKFSE